MSRSERSRASERGKTLLTVCMCSNLFIHSIFFILPPSVCACECAPCQWCKIRWAAVSSTSSSSDNNNNIALPIRHHWYVKTLKNAHSHRTHTHTRTHSNTCSQIRILAHTTQIKAVCFFMTRYCQYFYPCAAVFFPFHKLILYLRAAVFFVHCRYDFIFIGFVYIICSIHTRLSFA